MFRTRGVFLTIVFSIPILLVASLLLYRAKIATVPMAQQRLISVPPQCSQGVRDVVNLPEGKIDVGVAAFVFAKEVYPDIDIPAYSARIDALADRVRQLAKGTTDPDQRIRCLNTVLLLHEKFQGTRNLATARKSEKYYLNRVLDMKQGNCVSMPFLYIAVSQRLGWPVYSVNVPDHSFVRYVDPALKEQNIETTSNGGYVSDDDYAKDFHVSETGRRQGTYLRTLTRRDVLSDMAAINGISWAQKKDLAAALAYLKLSTELNPQNVAAWANLAISAKIMAKHSANPAREKYLALASDSAKKMKDLGFVNPKEIPEINSGRELKNGH